MKTYTCMLMYTDTRSQTRTPTQAQEQAGTQTYLHKRSHTNTYTQCIHTMHTYHQRRSHYSLIVCAYEYILHVVLPPPSGSFTVSVCLPVCSFLFSFVFSFSLLLRPFITAVSMPLCLVDTQAAAYRYATTHIKHNCTQPRAHNIYVQTHAQVI